MDYRCIVHKVVHPPSEGEKRLGERISVSLSGNSCVWARSKYSRRWRHIGSRRIRAVKKLDESKARWIIAQKRKGMTNARIAETMRISVRWVKKISARYSNIDADKIVHPMPMGRPRDSLPGRSVGKWPAIGEITYCLRQSLPYGPNRDRFQSVVFCRTASSREPGTAPSIRTDPSTP